MQKYPFIPTRDFSFIRPQIFLKYVERFSTKQIKCRYLNKINEKSRAGLNGYLYIKNSLLWEWHFHKLLCEKMIFPMPSGKNNDFVLQSIIFCLEQWKYHFFTQKLVEMPNSCSHKTPPGFSFLAYYFSILCRNLQIKKDNLVIKTDFLSVLQYQF